MTLHHQGWIPLSADTFRPYLRPCVSATQEGFAAALKVLDQTPPRSWGLVLQALRELEAHPWVFQLILAFVWRVPASQGVIDAAGTRENLIEWFTYARFDWLGAPMLHEVVHVWVAKEVRLYRGGRGDAAQVAAGYSWTPIKAIAGCYATSSPSPRPNSGGLPIVVRRVVPRQHVRVAWLCADQEHVVLDPGPWSDDTRDIDELADLTREARQMQAQFQLDRAEFIQRWLAFVRAATV